MAYDLNKFTLKKSMTEQKKDEKFRVNERIESLVKKFFKDNKITDDFKIEENKNIKSELITLIEKVVKIEEQL